MAWAPLQAGRGSRLGADGPGTKGERSGPGSRGAMEHKGRYSAAASVPQRVSELASERRVSTSLSQSVSVTGSKHCGGCILLYVFHLSSSPHYSPPVHTRERDRRRIRSLQAFGRHPDKKLIRIRTGKKLQDKKKKQPISEQV